MKTTLLTMATLYRGSSSEREDLSDKYQTVNDPLAIIYNEGLWKINKVSPLCNLRYSAVKLKQYASKIRQALVRLTQSNETVKYTVKFEELPQLKYSESDANCILITVSWIQGKSTNNKDIYMAIILSWGVSTSLENATHLPYMLERGEQKVGTVVKSTLQTVFDCNIQQFTFNQCQILQGGFMFVENDTSRSNDPFTLVYKSPQTADKSRLTLSFDVGDIRHIWNKIKNEESNPSEQVCLAYKLLQNQIFNMSSLDVTVFDLCEVNLPKAEMKNIGVVKMKTPETVNCFFTLLNEITTGDLWNDSNNCE